jgi:hypothetical protein
MPEGEAVPTVEELVADLRVLRERGLVRLRHTDLAHLSRAAGHSAGAVAGGPDAVEVLVRAAVDNLGGGSLGDAATATFGLGRGARDRPASDRRRHAALVYGVSVERFRKHHERVVLEQVAEEVLKLCLVPAPAGRLTGPPAHFDRQVRLRAQLGGPHFPVVIHIEPVELLSDVDILVVPENIYLELPQYFKSSVSAAVRRAAATRSPDGEIVTDVIAGELQAWVRSHGRAGLPVAAGTIAPTSSGAMASQGVRRIYHAAIVSPLPGTNSYEVEPAAIAITVRNVTLLARSDPALADQAARSLAFPLLGTGRGGLDPATSFSWIWAALERDMRDNGPWEIHFIARNRAQAELIVARLAELGVVTPPSAHQAAAGTSDD